MIQNTDPLDAAYLAIGAARELDRLGKHRALDVAELDVIALAVEAAPILQKLWEEQGEDWAGVWAYDVAEPLGAWIAREYVADESELTHKDVEEAARDFVRVAKELTG